MLGKGPPLVGTVLAPILVVVIGVLPAAAQSATAVLRGKITDEQGGALSGVQVTARNVDTKLSRSVNTNQLGFFFIPNLPVGSYELSAALRGFATAKRSGLLLRVGLEGTVDLALRVGQMTEEVMVAAEALILETTRNTVGTIISKDQIDQLPVIERDFASLAKLSPGVTIGAGTTGDNLAINGQHGFMNGFFVDGATAEWQYYGRQSSTFVQDWIQEFQVMTNSYPAEFGTASGGIINAITRSGTNEIHGRAYGFFRDDSLDAAPFAGSFDASGKPEFFSDKDKPPLSQQRLGAFLSGSIVKDKLFFFVGYEHLKKDSSEVLGITGYWRDRGIKSVLPLEGRDNPFIVKLDANVNPKNRVSLRFDRTDRKDTNQTQLFGALETEEVRYTFGGPIWNVVGTWASTLGSAKFNEFRAVYGSNKPPIICNKSGSGGRDNLRERPGTFSIQIYPGAVFGCPIFTGLEGEQTFQLIDNVSFAAGRHQFKVGGQAYRVQTIVDATNFHDGYWTFPNDIAFDINNPDSYPDVFNGNVGVVDVNVPSWNYYAFVQDTWQVSDQLSLNLGLRYDLDTSVQQGNELVDQKNAQLVKRYDGPAPLERTRVDTNNMAPRVGIVWTPTADTRTTLRAAAGRFYDQNHSNFNAIYYANTLLADRFILFDANAPFSYGPFGGPEALRRFLAESFPYFPDLTNAPAPSDIIIRNDPHLKVSYTDQFTAGVRHDFGHGLAVDADYVHVRGNGMPIYIEENIELVNGEYIQPDLRFATIATLKSMGWSRYNGLLTQVRFRKGKGMAEVSYTLSKVTTNNNTVIFGDFPTNPLDLSEDEGPDTVDRRHNLAVNGQCPLPWDIQLGGIWIYRSAPPYSVTTSVQLDLDPFPDRPAPRNSRRGDSFQTMDLRLSKSFKAGQRVRITAFWELYNAFNTDNFNDYVGQSESPLFGNPTAAFEKRRQQGGFRIDF